MIIPAFHWIRIVVPTGTVRPMLSTNNRKVGARALEVGSELRGITLREVHIFNQDELNGPQILLTQTKSTVVVLALENGDLDLAMLDIQHAYRQLFDLGAISLEEALTHNNEQVRSYGLRREREGKSE